jgi:hypothetical protein
MKTWVLLLATFLFLPCCPGCNRKGDEIILRDDGGIGNDRNSKEPVRYIGSELA